MRYRVPPGVAHLVDQDGEDSARVYLMPLPDGPPGVLEGSAAVIWLAVVEGQMSTSEDVATLFEEAGPEVPSQVANFLDDLVRRGFLASTIGRGPDLAPNGADRPPT